jgi:serine/threonine-protein kinase HipA
MTDDRLVVLLDDRVAGVLTRDRAGGLTFAYDADYQALPDPTPLSLSMPVAVARHGARAVTPWLWGLLPDNDAVLELWARRFGVSRASPFGLLSAPPGADCAGAVRFVADDDAAVQEALERPGRVRWLDDGDVAHRLDELTVDSSAWLGTDFAGRFSLAGAQAKTALLRDGDRWGLPEGSAATTHILKPAISGLDDHDLNEHVCLSAARVAGLRAARSELLHIAGQSAVVVTRYDRVEIGTTWQRVHQEDVCQALRVPPARKYQSDGGPGPADIAALLRSAMPARVAEAAVRDFADALVWNWLIGGTDAHAKNYSVLLSGSQVRLAPLYDVASALPYAHERKLKLAMKFGGDYRLHTQRPSTWRVLAGDLAIDEAELRARAGALIAAAGEAFASVASQIEREDTSLARQLVEAVRRRAEWCAATLDS